jgi:hypothetical protein
VRAAVIELLTIPHALSSPLPLRPEPQRGISCVEKQDAEMGEKIKITTRVQQKNFKWIIHREVDASQQM